MSDESWGIKRICASCGTKFYDFNKSPIVCPNCEAIFDPEAILKKKKPQAQSEEDIELKDFDGDEIEGDDSMDEVLPEEDEDEDLSLNDEKN